MSRQKRREPDALTTNNAAAFSDTGKARLDLYFLAVRGLAEANLQEMLVKSWAEDSLDTVKLVFQARDCRGGKGEKLLFHQCLKWFAAHHPSVLKENAKHIPFFGSWKDVLCLLGTSFEEQALELIAAQLRKDLADIEAQTDGKHSSISLCAKWMPTESHGEDKKTHAASKIAKFMFKDSKTAKADYRKKVIRPLRAHLQLVEELMCAGQWDKINYSSVPSRCMNKMRKAFKKNDGTRFEAFLGDVKEGKTEIKGKQMFPHELVNHYMTTQTFDDVVELQWKTLIAEVEKEGSLSDSIVVSDVSGSMSGTPMQVSIALGLLISEVTKPPFTNAVITFEENPKFHIVKGTTLQERVKNLAAAPWGGTTNFDLVFDAILEKAAANKIPESAMPKRLFVISDMQFNAAGGGRTNFQAIQQKYAKAGYKMPAIIFWNVRANNKNVPVEHDQNGVALVSGFSPSILKDLVSCGEFTEPFPMMKKVIDSERYSIITLDTVDLPDPK